MSTIFVSLYLILSTYAMKIVRFLDKEGHERFGIKAESKTVELLSCHPLQGTPEKTGAFAEIAQWLPPLEPRAIIGIGLNYRRHAEESGAKIPEYPVVFFKNPASAQANEAPITLPTILPSNEVDYECELAIVIGRKCKNASRADALQYVLGYTCANDVSARDWQIQRGGSQWCRGKSFDTFCPLGPVLTTADAIPDPNALRLLTRVNGETLQDWSTRDMIFDVPTLIEFLSADSTLLPGTVILTGTPHGVGMGRNPKRFLKSGETVEIEIEGIGTLTNRVQ